MRLLAWISQALATAALISIPIWWQNDFAHAIVPPFILYKTGHAWTLNGAALSFAISALVLVVAQWYDKYLSMQESAREQKLVLHNRAFVDTYAAAVNDSVSAAYLASRMTQQERYIAQKNILIAIANIVHFFYEEKEGLEINACYMLAYGVDTLPNGIAERIRFTERKRPISTYGHVLDLALWAYERPDLPKALALPVEDPNDDIMRYKLLPGAPAAFALGRIEVVESTDDLDPYFRGAGKSVDPVVREEQLNYFRERGFKSFVSIPLTRNRNEKIFGVLNVQSNKTAVLGPKNCHQKLVTDLLGPFAHALGFLT
jgi:hypothetical protein